MIRFAALFVMLPIAVAAEPVRLACTQSNGQSAGTVTIDIAAGTFQHGAISLEIVTDAPEYLTAMSTSAPSPGGTVWVLVKATGQFQMSNVGLSCSTVACTDKRLTGFTMQGSCQRALF